ncbi:Wadjet anti-phage system protein JetA family protein [Rubritalea tangerina]|uniref:Wadjet anti-phage system protein JetA family protein n=1 Tax=Rubritalea tangerina TaxID=430798 RepID=A0ABW4Z6G8_9BACT
MSQQIFRDTPSRFFAVLTWRYGKLYIDALDKIESIQRHRHGVGLTRSELIEVCEDIINEGIEHIELPEDLDDEQSRITAPEMIRQMLQSEWLEEPKRSDYQRVYYLDSRAELLLECLRRMAYPEQVTFTDKLHLVCSRIMDKEAFEKHPLADLEACTDNLRYGLQELRSIQQGMARLTQRQLRSDSIKENLQVLYDDFSENIGQRAYKSLIDLDIPVRLPMAREQLAQIQTNPTVIAKMELELQKRRPELNEDEVEVRVQNALHDAARLLDSVEPQAEAVDRRAADFARRSFARFRYLQEVSSGRRAEVRELFELINEKYAECKINALPEDLDLPGLKIPAVSLLSGIDSLFSPRVVRAKGEQAPLQDLYEDDDSFYALEEMSDNINSSLTTLRANRFYHELNVTSDGLKSKDIPTDVEQWLLNTIGLLLHSDTLESEYDITTPRDAITHDILPEPDQVEDMLLDQFTIHPKAR